MNKYERETVINASDGDEIVRIWTAQRTMITKLRKNPAFTEVASGFVDGSAWAEFTIPPEDFRVTAKRKVSNKERARLSEHAKQHLHAPREPQNAT